MNIHKSLDKVFKVGPHQFVFIFDDENATVIDEVYFWAKTVQRRNKTEVDLL